jgi:nucleotide-binding universal stress UspA family protein
MKLTKILAPTDFSNCSGFSMEWAAYLAHMTKAELLLLHVVSEEEGKIVREILGDGAVAQIAMGTRADVLEERRRKMRGQYEAAISRHIQQELKVREMVRIGIPFLEIVRVAKEEEVDMIILGTHGRTGLSHVLIGSVAEKVVHHAHCPVLTIKHPQYQFVSPI